MAIEATGKGETAITAAVLIIGDEILSGRTKDRNLGYIAEYLTKIGIRLREARVVTDVEEEIATALNDLRARYDYVFTTGGIGPTHDDVTADSVARAFGVSIDVDERALAMMRERFGESMLTGRRLRMARLPQGAEPVANPVSAAPGFMIENVIVMAGVPAIMEVMLDDVAPRLRTGARLLTSTLRVDRPEGHVAEPLANVQDRFPDVSIGSYPYFDKGRLGTYVVMRSTAEARLEEVREALEQALTTLSA